MAPLSRILRLSLLLPLGLSRAEGQDVQRLLADCNVEWSTPSEDSRGSMPLPGLAGAGANVWFAQGELRLYLAHNGAYDGDEVLRKLGSLRIKVEGVDLAKPRTFSQTLRLSDGTLVVKAVANDGTEVEHRLWFGGETLVIETRSSRAAALEVAFGHWRANPALRGDDQVNLAEGALLYTHRNTQARRTRQLASEQGVDPAKIVSPAADRLYGCALVGRAGLAWRRPVESRALGWPGHEWAAVSAAARSHLLAISLGAGRKLDPERLASRSQTVADPEVTPSIRRTAELRWEEFWARSHVFIQPKAGPADPRFQVGRNYNLSRFMEACNQRGELPLRPNGAIYTVEPPSGPFPAGLDVPALGRPATRDPDARRGGQDFAGQALRWSGWAAGPDGDGDLREPLLRFYRDRHALAQSRAKALRAEGAVYPERMSLAGLTDGGAGPDGLARNPQLTRHFSSGLEHAWMTLHSLRYSGRDIRPDLPWILDQVRFVESHLGAPSPSAKSGKGDGERLVIGPANAMEAASGATNPAQLVAALHALIPVLAERTEVAEKDRAWLRALQPRLPGLPRVERRGAAVLALADRWTRLHQPWDTPELHALWPYRLVGRSNPETQELALATWQSVGLALDGRTDRPERRSNVSGAASLAYAAALGLAEEAGKRAVAKLADAASPWRFKAFAGPGREWIPDLTWSASGRAGVQEMLLECEPAADGRITLLPAWPKDWDVTFRLRAPGNTRVTCVVVSGRIERLVVDPPARREHVVAGEGWQLPSSDR
jgi:hypothetical protein